MQIEGATQISTPEKALIKIMTGMGWASIAAVATPVIMIAGMATIKKHDRKDKGRGPTIKP